MIRNNARMSAHHLLFNTVLVAQSDPCNKARKRKSKKTEFFKKAEQSLFTVDMIIENPKESIKRSLKFSK